MYGNGTMTLGRLRARQNFQSDYCTYVVQSNPRDSCHSDNYQSIGSPTRMAFHLEVGTWLQTLELEEYIPLFHQAQDVKDLLHWTEKNLLDIGIRDAAHRARLISNLVYIREKLKRTSCTSGCGLPPLATPPRSPRSVPPLATPPRSPRSVAPPSCQSPASPSRHIFRYSSIPEDLTSKTPPSPNRSKMSLLDMTPDDLRRQLEEELRLPGQDVRSHAWFHGGISREKADRLIRENGDFLVRDSISKPGNFVLTVRWKSVPMHFVINKVVYKAHSPYASVQYQFEKECFDTIPSLIKFYVGNCKPVSQASGAVIQRPINRTLPLSYTDSKYAATNKSHAGVYIYGQLQKKVVTPRRGSINGNESLRQRSGSSPLSVQVNGHPDKTPVNRTDSHPLLGRTSPNERFASPAHVMREQYRRTGSEPILSPSQEFRPIENDYAETKPCFNTSVSDEEGNSSGGSSRGSHDGSSTASSPIRVPMITSTPPDAAQTSDTMPSPSSDTVSVDQALDGAPQTSALEESSKREHIYSEINRSKDPVDTVPVRYTMLKDDDSSPVIPVIPEPCDTMQDQIDGQDLDVKPRKRVQSGTRFSLLDGDYSQVSRQTSSNHPDKKPDVLHTVLPLHETESVFLPQELSSMLLAPDNKPLHKVAMDTVRQMLIDNSCLSLARHLTLADTEVCRISHGTNNNSMPGLELLCLPHGTRLRQDILERHNCLKMFCMSTLLTCDDPEIRVHILNQWIQLAETLRGSLGNLYSFATIMDALATKQICYLRNTWDQLRARFTNTAVNYDTKLRSLLKSLNAGENVVPLTKTCLPHILPIIQLMDRDWSKALDRDWSQTATKEALDSLPSGQPWEESAASYGLDIMLGHLQNAHMLAQQTNLYRINANAKLAKHPPDEGLLEVFRTEFHLRLLWGSRVTTDNSVERYRLLEQVLSIMAQKMEFSGNSV